MDEKTVGGNIRAIRERAGLNLATVSARASITTSALSKIEQGQTSSPIATLLSIADALGVSLATFFTEPTKRPDFVITRKGEGKMMVRDGSKFGYAYEALSLEMPGKRVEPFILTTKPGEKTREGKFQHGGQEFNYVLSGKFEMQIGEEKVILSTGDSIYFNPRLVHGVTRLLGREPVRILCLFIQDDSHAPTAKPASSKNGKSKSKVK